MNNTINGFRKKYTYMEKKVIGAFCKANGIYHSKSWCSFYFMAHGTHYRVSNHTIQESDAGMYIYSETGERIQIRESYHLHDPEDLICITAVLPDIINIFTKLVTGVSSRGNSCINMACAA